MEADCSEDKCLIHDKSSEQLLISSTSNPEIISTTNGANIKQLITMHHEEIQNGDNNDMMFDKLLENLSFPIVNIDTNDSRNIIDGPDDGQFTLPRLIFAVLFCLLIIVVIIGNTLVILSVLTTRRLRTVTNLFVTSLAVADWLVGIFVMPPAVAYYLMGKKKTIKLYLAPPPLLSPLYSCV